VKINNHGVAAAARVEAEAAGGHFDDLMARMAGCFRRWEPRTSAKKYVRALMSDLPRKSCWTIAEYAGDATPGKMQHLLEAAKWDTMAAMAAVRAFVCEHLDDADAVAILDESGQEKKGKATVGVKRQYVGCAGRVSNAINIVYCSFATKAGHALVGARPYLPREWATDPDRRAQARVPEELAFATKPQLGRQILADLHAEGRLPPWVTGDEVYGADPNLRAWMESVGAGYVLAVAKSTPIAFTKASTARADTALKMLIAADWVIESCGAGSKGGRRYAWAWIGTADPRRHLLIRRSLVPNDKGIREMAFYLCFVPEGRPVTLRTLINVAGRRWPVEEDFQIAKDAFGLDHSQVRIYPALLRHLVLTMAAPAVVAITAAHARRTTTTATTTPPPTSPHDTPPADTGLIPLTVVEMKRLVNLLTRSWHGLQHHLRWHLWRRRHQARARWFHQRTRLAHR
jgi:SRSO17 transposase